jgi:hypothetical protein
MMSRYRAGGAAGATGTGGTTAAVRTAQSADQNEYDDPARMSA